MNHPRFPSLLDHAAGRHAPGVKQHLATCAACAARAVEAGLLVKSGRDAVQSAEPSRRAKRRALAAFRPQRARGSWSVLDLVLDTLGRAAPAVRSTRTRSRRFLRFEGETIVEIEVSPAARGVELRGQLTPPDFASEVVLVVKGKRKRVSVDSHGVFLFRAVPRKEVDLIVGNARIEKLEL